MNNKRHIKPIPTLYKGVWFRSRLEARWAVFWETLGLEWEFEKQGYILDNGEPYLCDFWLPQVKLWAEVKPEPFTPEELDKCRRLAEGGGYAVILLEGLPEDRAYPVVGPHDDFFDYDVILNNDRYPQTEGRFFSHVGCNCAWFRREGCDLCRSSSAAEARDAAKSAKFEHGKRGAA